jgi:anaerobic magnesium-protoporphyrin IX monomethyl ester cyclase
MRALTFSMPDVTPHFFEEYWKVPGAIGPLLAANAPQHVIAHGDLVTQRRRVREAIASAISEYRPQVVGLSAMSFQFYSACRTAEVIRAIDPGIKIGLGGYHATTSASDIATGRDAHLFDFLVRGEGEATFSEYLDRLEDGRVPEDVLGLSFRSGADWVHNPPRPNLDLGRLRPPTRDVRIWKDYGYFGHKLDVFESSRGCTFDCAFCSITMMYGRSLRKFPIDHVLASIEDARRQGATTLMLSDDNFALDAAHFEAVCRTVIEHKFADLIYQVQVAPRLIALRPDLVDLMAEAGFRVAFLGAESINPKRLKVMDALQKGGEQLEYTMRAVDLLRRKGIWTVVGLIMGLPDDTPEDIEQNFRWCAEHDVSIADFLVTPHAKTRQGAELTAAGYVTCADFRRYDGFWANVQTNWMSPWELEYWRWFHYRQYVTLRHHAEGLKMFSRLAHAFINYVLRPLRTLDFKMRDPVRSFERYQRQTALVNHLFGERFPDMFTHRTTGGRLGRLADRPHRPDAFDPRPGE